MLMILCWWKNFDLGWHSLNVGDQNVDVGVQNVHPHKKNDQSRHQNLEVVTNTALTLPFDWLFQLQDDFKLRRRYGHWIWANFNWKVFLKNFRKSGIFRFHIEFKDKSDNRLKNFSSRCFFLCCPLPASLSMICVRRAQHDDHGAPPSSFAIRFKPRARTTTRSPPRYRSTKHLYFLLKTLTLQTVSRDNFDRDY